MMDDFEIEAAKQAYKNLKHGQPSAQSLVDAADILRRAVDLATDHAADTGMWDY